MLNSPEIPNNNSKTFLPKIPTQNSFHQQSFEQQNPNNFLLPINQNLMNNTGLLSNNSFLPSIFPGNTNFNNNFNPNMNTQIMESLKNAKIKKMQRVQRKNTEELVYKALEKQTEMLNEIAKRFKKQAEEDENKLLKKIKELERENSEILWQRRNEDIIQQKVIDSKTKICFVFLFYSLIRVEEFE